MKSTEVRVHTYTYWFKNGFHRRVHRQVPWRVFAYETPNAFDRLKFSYVREVPEKPLKKIIL